MSSRELNPETAESALRDFTRNYEFANSSGKFSNDLRLSYLHVLSHEEDGFIPEEEIQQCRTKFQSLYHRRRV